MNFCSTYESKTLVSEIIRLLEDDNSPLISTSTLPRHSIYCECNGDWNRCCDNPANYPDTCCGCNGDWALCDNNREFDEHDKFDISACPSPHRHDDDWFTQEVNPVNKYIDIPVRSPTIPYITRKRPVRESYLKECVKRYYSV